MTIFLILFLFLVGAGVIYALKPVFKLSLGFALMPFLFIKSVTDAFKPGNRFHSKRWFGLAILIVWVALVTIEIFT